jgi:type VI secretion system protein ImpK
MSGHNPFAEDGDDDADKTVIRPAPAGRRAAAAPILREPVATAPEQYRQPPPQTPIIGDGAETIDFSLNPLVGAAAPLFQLMGRMRTTYTQPHAMEVRDRTLRQVQAFEQAARAAGVTEDQLDKGRFAVCASIDDLAQSTPWGGDGGWASRPLVLSFRDVLRSTQGVQSGVGFFRLLDEVRVNPGTELPVLEVMYLCLSLGFQGQYRASRQGPAELDRIREDVYTIIKRQRQDAAAELSPHWRGIKSPYKAIRAVVPSWVIAAVSIGLIALLFVWLSTTLNAASDDVFARLRAAPLTHFPQIARAPSVRPAPPIVVPPPAAPDPLYVFLKPEIDQGLVTVTGDHSTPVVRIRNTRTLSMFASGTAIVAPNYVRLLERIGEALKAEKGPVQVTGYTDNQPIHTVQFPSNYQLSAARAEAARAIIIKALGDPPRVSADGRADADPIGDNATKEGQNENRRIEVVLRRQG